MEKCSIIEERYTSEKQDSQALINYSKGKSIFFDNYDFIKENSKFVSGVESDVYMSKDGKYVYKINNGIYYKTWGQFLKRIQAHNIYFPDTYYQIFGFTFKENKLAIILKQPFFYANEAVEIDLIKKDLEQSGFYFNHKYNVTDNNNNVVLRDFHSENILIAKNKSLVYIDPIIEINENSILFENTILTAYKNNIENNVNNHLNILIENVLQTKTIAVSGGAFQFKRQLPDFKIKEILLWLEKNNFYCKLICSTKEEFDRFNQFKLEKKLIHLVILLNTVYNIIAEIKYCDLMISTDSAWLHIAELYEIETIGLFGFNTIGIWDPPHCTPILSNPHYSVDDWELDKYTDKQPLENLDLNLVFEKINEKLNAKVNL